MPEQNEPHSAENFFKCIFLNDVHAIQIEISLKYVLEGLAADMSTLLPVIVPNHVDPNQWNQMASLV